MVRGKSLPEGVHRTRAKLADGSYKYYFSLRGCKGTGFWSGFDPFPRTPEFLAAFVKMDAASKPRPVFQSNAEVIAEYLVSATFKKKKLRTQADYRRWLARFEEEFGLDDITMWESPASKRELNGWRRRWIHSPRQYDYCATVVRLFLNWAVDHGFLNSNACQSFEHMYEVDRSGVVWSPRQIRQVMNICPKWVARILITATETGLRIGDFTKLTWSHIESTPNGRRIRVRTSKRGIPAYIPVTPMMAEVLDETPTDRLLILTNASGGQLTPHRASEGVRQWRDKAGLTPQAVGEDLRLNDARGTAATWLLRAGLSLAQIAAHMGWSLRTAANMIERYAQVSPDETDEVLHLLENAKRTSIVK